MDEEMRQPEEMVSVIDGKKVQEILVGRYLNVVIVDHTDFMKHVEGRLQIRHKFYDVDWAVVYMFILQ